MKGGGGERRSFVSDLVGDKSTSSVSKLEKNSERVHFPLLLSGFLSLGMSAACLRLTGGQMGWKELGSRSGLLTTQHRGGCCQGKLAVCELIVMSWGNYLRFIMLGFQRKWTLQWAQKCFLILAN